MPPYEPGQPPRFDPYAPPAYGPGPQFQGYYGTPYGPPAPASSRATWALVLSVLGWAACGCLTSLPGVILARSELSAIARGESSPAGKGLATAGFWIGVINLVLYVLVAGVMAASFAFSPGGFQ